MVGSVNLASIQRANSSHCYYCRQLEVAPPSPLAVLAYIVSAYIVVELILAQYVVNEEIASFSEISQEIRQLYNGLQRG